MSKRRLLILGSGFGSFAFLRHLTDPGWEVTVVSPRNHFLFTPLLPSTAVGSVEFRSIIEPVRATREGVRFLLGQAEALDPEAKAVVCRSPEGGAVWTEAYDALVIGVGCTSNTFGVPGVREHAFLLKEIDDARRIRQRLITNLEQASLPGLPEVERDRLLHFVAVGAGPTGVRFAAELHDLLVDDLPRSYPHLADHVRVTLLDAGPTLLGLYDEKLREHVAGVFHRRGIEVLTRAPVARVRPDGVELHDGRTMPCGLVLWCAGFGPLPFIQSLHVAKDRAGRILTDDALRVPGWPDVYALGDCARPESRQFPQLAQVAEQQGRHLAAQFNEPDPDGPPPFRWKRHGMGSYLGSGDAVMESPDGRGGWTGYVAYQQWRGAIWTDLVSTRNRVLVPLDRLRAWVFGRDLSKL